MNTINQGDTLQVIIFGAYPTEVTIEERNENFCFVKCRDTGDAFHYYWTGNIFRTANGDEVFQTRPPFCNNWELTNREEVYQKFLQQVAERDSRAKSNRIY